MMLARCYQMLVVCALLHTGIADAKAERLRQQKRSHCYSDELVPLLAKNYSDMVIFRYAQTFENCDITFWFEAPMRIRHATKGVLTVYTKERLTVKVSTKGTKSSVCIERFVPSRIGSKPVVVCK
jgi:hypothetical protein